MVDWKGYGMERNRRQQGFSLIELLIVVAIILVIAAIAIPNLLKSRMSANESAAVGSVKAINAAETTLIITYPNNGYTCIMTHLGPPPPGVAPNRNTGADLVGADVASGVKSGYALNFTNCPAPPRDGYNIDATPLSIGTTGLRAFCSSEAQTIYFAADGTANTCYNFTNTL